MPKFALFTIDCAQTSPAIAEIVKRHHREITHVVTSDVVNKGGRLGIIKQSAENLATRGFGFAWYLASSFLLHPIAIGMDRAIATISRGRRTRFSIAELCAQYDIAHIHTANINSPSVIRELEAAGIDFIVVYWFDQILRESIIAVPKRAVVNVHAAYLPECKGLFPGLYSALQDGQPFGVTAHLIDSRAIDAGPILAQRVTVPPAGRSVLFYDTWVNSAGVDLLDEVLADFDSFYADAKPQTGGSYYSYPSRADLLKASRMNLPLTSLRDSIAVFNGVEIGG